MRCTIVYDLDNDQVVAFWWSDTYRLAVEKMNQYRDEYRDTSRYEISIEGERVHYSIAE